MDVVLRRRVVEIVDVRADPIHQRSVQRVHALAASQNAGGGLAGIWAQSLDGAIHGRIDAAAQRASNVIDDRPAGFVAHVLGDAFNPACHDIRCERLGFEHCFEGRQSLYSSAVNLPLSSDLAQWASRVQFEDLPADVVEATKLRVMDVIGLSLAGAETAFGKSTREAIVAMSPAGPCRILGFGDRVGVTAAAFANGALSQALEYDDTHNESIVHMSSPAVAAALALSEFTPVTGRALITAIALGNEISCRVGSVSSGELHKRGFHPTGLFATFGAAYLAAKLLRLDAEAMARAAGISGSFASGLLECWVDGTQTKFLHPGWSAQSGITAAMLARAGVTGPAQVFEGRWGLFASHVQDPDAHRDFARINADLGAGLGTHWESRNSSFKPYPAAHVSHPYISAAIRLRNQHSILPGDIE